MKDQLPEPEVVPEAAAERRTIARRKLLGMAYVAPLVIGTLLISEDAAGQTVSCPPNGGPCRPDGGACGPSVVPCKPAGNCKPSPPPRTR